MKMDELKNVHTGEELIVLGNGPSLSEIKFSRLKQKHTFGMNKLSSVFDQTEWRPDYYLFQGRTKHDRYKEYAEKAINEGITTFIQEDKSENYEASENITYFNRERISSDDVLDILDIETLKQRKSSELPNAVDQIWSADADKRIYSYLNSMVPLCQIASYMGFSDIYFIGCDGYEVDRPYMIFSHATNPRESDASGPIEFLSNSTYPVKSFANGVAYKLLSNGIGSKIYAKLSGNPNYYPGTGHDKKVIKFGSKYKKRNARLELAHWIIEEAGRHHGFKTYNATPDSNLNIHKKASLEAAVS